MMKFQPLLRDMEALLVAAVVVTSCMPVSQSTLIADKLGDDSTINNKQLLVIHQELERACPSFVKTRRALINRDHPMHIEIQKELYQQLWKELRRCKQLAAQKTTPAVKPNSTPKEQATPKRQTTPKPKVRRPLECRNAVQFKESWRKDHDGSNLKPGGPCSLNGYACDLSFNATWFQFKGAAGNMMLDRCPKENSCGASVAMWTDWTMPQEVGVVARVNAHGLRGDNCKYLTEMIRVMRCSYDKPNDFIYKLTSPRSANCEIAFCGMSKV